jgi:DNA polymerase-3 subunit gamma/tau
VYQALYRKWRPRTFDDVVGQEHISGTLKNQIVTGRLSHAYLFVGTRGTGKTTCAKILARAVNCTNPQNGNPCNKCPSCLGIEDGSILDVLELDAASNNGVDNVRALREEAVFTPVDVKKRVYIIDEVHMLSTAAFNALLKILEEPPEHLMFILATTEIHKVPATILSRCQRFTFKRILPERIQARLLYVAGREGLTLTEDAAGLLSRLADGSLRDALSLLDQCASGDTIDRGRVLSAIGLAGSDEIAGILTFVAGRDTAGALAVLDRLYLAGKVMSSVLEELMDLIRDILVVSLMPDGGTGLLSGRFDRPALEDFKKRFAPAQLLDMMNILRAAAQEMSRDSGGRLSAELCLMRLCDNRLAGDLSSVLARVSALEEALERGAGVQAFRADPAPARGEPQPAPAAVAEKQAEPAPAAVPPATDPAKPDDKPAEPVPAADPDISSGEAWSQILGRIKKVIDIPPYMFLSDTTHTSVSIEGNTVIIKAKNDFAANVVGAAPVTAAIKEAAAAVLGTPALVRVAVDSGNTAGGGNKLDALLGKFNGVIKEE